MQRLKNCTFAGVTKDLIHHNVRNEKHKSVYNFVGNKIYNRSTRRFNNRDKKNAGPEPKFAFLLELLFLPEQRASFHILLLLLDP